VKKDLMVFKEIKEIRDFMELMAKMESTALEV
jgi:hypothetical protein